MHDNRDWGLLPEPELDTLGQKYGTRAEIWKCMAADFPGFWDILRDTATRAGHSSESDKHMLLECAKSPHAALRYWAVTGLGLLEASAPREEIVAAMDGPTPTVRVGAALALFRCGAGTDAALNLLRRELQSPLEWIRMSAAIALDELGEAAQPATPELQEALNDTHNKYVVRVVNHTLNQLIGTNNQVP